MGCQARFQELYKILTKYRYKFSHFQNNHFQSLLSWYLICWSFWGGYFLASNRSVQYCFHLSNTRISIFGLRIFWSNWVKILGNGSSLWIHRDWHWASRKWSLDVFWSWTNQFFWWYFSCHLNLYHLNVWSVLPLQYLTYRVFFYFSVFWEHHIHVICDHKFLIPLRNYLFQVSLLLHTYIEYAH